MKRKLFYCLVVFMICSCGLDHSRNIDWETQKVFKCDEFGRVNKIKSNENCFYTSFVYTNGTSHGNESTVYFSSFQIQADGSPEQLFSIKKEIGNYRRICDFLFTDDSLYVLNDTGILNIYNVTSHISSTIESDIKNIDIEPEGESFFDQYCYPKMYFIDSYLLICAERLYLYEIIADDVVFCDKTDDFHEVSGVIIIDENIYWLQESEENCDIYQISNDSKLLHNNSFPFIYSVSRMLLTDDGRACYTSGPPAVTYYVTFSPTGVEGTFHPIELTTSDMFYCEGYLLHPFYSYAERNPPGWIEILQPNNNNFVYRIDKTYLPEGYPKFETLFSFNGIIYMPVNGNEIRTVRF